MNTYRYDEEARRQWVRDKMTGARSVGEICQEAQISRATLYNWIREFENSPPITAHNHSKIAGSARAVHQSIEGYRMLVTVLSAIDKDRTVSRKLVAALMKRFTLSVSQACAVVGLDETDYGYKPRMPEAEDHVVYMALIEKIREDRSRDFETCYKLLKEKHPEWTRKQIKRIYRDGMIYLERSRSPNRWAKWDNASVTKMEEPKRDWLWRPGAVWVLDIWEDQSLGWILFLKQEGTAARLNATGGKGKLNPDVIVAFLDRAKKENGLPVRLKIPDVPALKFREINRWAWSQQMALVLLSMQKPENQSFFSKEQEVFTRMSTGQLYNGPEEMAEAWREREPVTAAP